MQHPRAAQKPCFVQPMSRKFYFSMRDSCKTSWSSTSSPQSRSSHSSGSLADSSMASCKSLSKRLLSLEAPGHRPSELVSRISWMALWGKRGGKKQPITSSIRVTAAPAFICPLRAHHVGHFICAPRPHCHSVPCGSGGVGALYR